MIKQDGQMQFVEKKGLFSLQIIVHHQRRQIQALKPGGWGRNHEKNTVYWLAKLHFLKSPGLLVLACTAHSGMGHPISISNKENATKT